MMTFATFSSADMAITMDLSGMTSQNNWELAELKLHLDASATTAGNNFVVQQRSKRGSYYDTVLLSQAMAGVTDILWQPDYAIKLNGKDRVDFTWTNDATKRSWGLQVNYKG